MGERLYAAAPEPAPQAIMLKYKPTIFKFMHMLLYQWLFE